MKNFKLILVIAVSAVSLSALPRYAMLEEVSCSSCHSYQGGGGSRTAYGNEYARESMIMKDMRLPWEKDESDLPVYFGLDTRYQMIAQTDKDLRQFPMQFALYAGMELGSIISHVEVSRISEEYRVTGGLRYEGLPFESWAFIGRELPVMGWRIDDHSVFTRGGNLTYVGLNREGMPYTPFIDPPTYGEIGSSPLPGLELSVMTGTPFIQPDASLDSKMFKAFKADYMYSGNAISVLAGLAILDENQMTQASVVHWGISSMGFVLLGELAQMDGWPRDGSSNFASMHQLSYRLIQGLDVISRYEFFDPDMDLQNGAINRMSLGLEIFPVRGVEVKLSYRRSQLDIPGTAEDPQSQILSQIHIYL